MAIAFKKISYIYDKDMPYAHKALDEIELEIEEGRITAVIGETGSGKSTLVEHLNALLIPHSGQIEILDHTIEANVRNKGLKALRKDVGLVFQFSEYQLFEETILKDVMFGPKNFGASDEEAMAMAKKALKLVGIDESMYMMSPLEISGGQKRRVAIAGIIAADPKILVLDEPTAGLDPMGSSEMISLFIDLNKKLGKTVIIVSHDNDMVYNYTDNTVLMSKGRLIYSGPTVDLFNNKELVNAYGLMEPQVIRFKNLLNDEGFKVPDDIRTLDDVVKAVLKEVRR